MCTFTLAWQVFEDSPVVVAANRDERLNRPSEPPARRDWDAAVVAPADGDAGGTWLGYNEHGVVVALTNRWLDTDREGERSRGLLVRDALACESAEAAIRHVESELDGRAYAGFNLVAVDEYAALLVEYDGRRRVSPLDPGIHIVVNVGADGTYAIPDRREEVGERQAANADAVRNALRPEPGEDGGGWLGRAAGVISDHEYGVCVHGDGFGTRSSSLIHVQSGGVMFEYADGPPCETAYESVDVTV